MLKRFGALAIAVLIVGYFSITGYSQFRSERSQTAQKIEALKPELGNIAMQYLQAKNSLLVHGQIPNSMEMNEPTRFGELLQESQEELTKERDELKKVKADYSDFDTQFTIKSLEIKKGFAYLEADEFTKHEFTHKDDDPLIPQYHAYVLNHRFTFAQTETGWTLIKDDILNELHPASYEKGDIAPALGYPETKIDHNKSGQFLLDENIFGEASTTLNRQAIIAYAFQYVWSPNPAYRYFHINTSTSEGGDCTNFVSQCLRAGGWRDVSGFYQSSAYWWYNWSNQTWSWTSANYFFQFVGYRPRATLVTSTSGIQLGDIVQADFNRDGRIDHSMVCTRISNGEVYLTYHSGPALNKSLTSLRQSKPLMRIYVWRLYSYPN